MKRKEIFLFELRYQLGRPLPWLFFVVLTLVTFLLTRDSSVEDALYHSLFINSPYLIVKSEAVAGMLWLIMAAAVAGEAGARDVQTGMHSLVYTTGVRKKDYIAGKFSAALVINMLILSALPIGSLIALYAPGLQPEVIGPVRPAAYLSTYAIFTLPNILFATALQFSFALRTGRPMAAYLGSILLVFMSYFLATFVRFFVFRQQGMLLDPLGVHFILENLGSEWTAYEKKWRLLAPEGIILANRLFWLSVGSLTLLFTSAGFRFAYKAGRSQRKPWYKKFVKAKNKTAVEVKTSEVSLPVVSRTFGLQFNLRQTVAITVSSFRILAKSRTGLVLLILIPLLAGLIIIDQMQAMGTPLTPVTVRVLKELTMPLANGLSRWAIVPLFTIFFAGELVWRERNARMDEITGALPGSAWARFAGRFLGLSVVLTLFILSLMVAGIAVQSILGYTDFEIGLYLKVLVGLQLPEYLLFAILALTVHTIVNQQYAGHLVNVLIYAYIAAFAGMLGVEHKLLVYGASPEWDYTSMSGFGASLTPWIWFKLYWAAFALMLAVIGQQFWVRGRENSFRTRCRYAARHFTKGTIVTGIISLLLLTATGGYIIYNLHFLNDYRSSADISKSQADYERLYQQYARLPQPQITSTRLNADIFPAERKVVIKGTYVLTNSGKVAIEDIHLTMGITGVSVRLLRFDQPTTLVLNDQEQGYRIYKLRNKLLPRDSISMDFEVQVERHGFTNRGADASITLSSTVFESSYWCPAIGYQSGRELIAASQRRDAGLPARPAVPALDDPARSRDQAGSGKTNFEAIVSTDTGQVAVAPGALRRWWQQGSRQYFHYAGSAPMPNGFTFFSGKYSILTDTFNGVQIRVFYFPGHTGHLRRTMQSVKASLSYNSAQFGAYPFSHLSIVEHPQAAGSSLHSEAGMIWYGQAYPFWQAKDEVHDIDQPYAVMAHEMGHQFQVNYAFAEGAPLLSESFAWYSAMQVFKESRGTEQLEMLRAFMREPYPFAPIRRGEPLLRALDPYLAYRRGPFALYTLAEYIGVEKVNAAFRQLREQGNIAGATLTTTLDLYRELKMRTPDSLQYLLHDLFEVNTFWKFKIGHASAKRMNDGTWQVQLKVNAEKTVYDEKGAAHVMPLHDDVEVAIFADSSGSASRIYLQQHHLRSSQQSLTISTKIKPRYISVDPRLLLIYIKDQDGSGRVEIQQE